MNVKLSSTGYRFIILISIVNNIEDLNLEKTFFSIIRYPLQNELGKNSWDEAISCEEVTKIIKPTILHLNLRQVLCNMHINLKRQKHLKCQHWHTCMMYTMLHRLCTYSRAHTCTKSVYFHYECICSWSGAHLRARSYQPWPSRSACALPGSYVRYLPT